MFRHVRKKIKREGGYQVLTASTLVFALSKNRSDCSINLWLGNLPIFDVVSSDSNGLYGI
ncbi:unnamed protein product [Thlaspi arvense]|uniref:Uncharacterized protein n=1 Tax=Thlaspi arvense TaxID=13288 RepID=A0AAU9RMS4_THLAR|nr:unnamed protein product [Thlaspi arvense]